MIPCAAWNVVYASKNNVPKLSIPRRNIQAPVVRHTERVKKKHRCPMKKTPRR